jgi:hypothetical protein
MLAEKMNNVEAIDWVITKFLSFAYHLFVFFFLLFTSGDVNGGDENSVGELPSCYKRGI